MTFSFTSTIRSGFWQKALVSLILVLFSIFSSTASYAKWGQSVAAELLNDGKQLYDQARYDEAAHQFSKVLLIDADNEEAKEYLAKMGISEGLYGYNKTPTEDIVDLSQTVQAKEQDILALEDENQKLDHFVQAQKQAYENALIQQKDQAEQIIASRNQEIDAMADLQREALSHLEQQQAMLYSAQHERAELAKSLASSQEKFSQTKDDLNAIEEAIKAKDQEIKALESTLAQKEKSLREEVMEREEEAVALSEEKTELDRAVFDARQAHYQDMETARKKIHETDTQLQLAQYQALVARHQATLQEGRLLEAQQRMQRMRQAYGELEQNFNKAHEIIARLKTEQTFRLSSQENKKDRDVFVKRLYRQDKLISELKKDLIVAKEELREIKAASAEPDEDAYRDLESKIATLEEELAKKEQELGEMKEDKQMLEARLKDVQEDFQEVQDMVVDRDQMIQQLDQDIDFPQE